ncbi:hypothetical protein GCM10025868_43410 [Angustibacter aerolatus]|uniref:AMP-dependent synthetase/ligase domain-containing protein n=1 Tax=Angustibacter aerolatus TaxID=1162965 RepID=A0ABQ6JQY4_9ACTN|nr:AMP-binding protein [Angustibacter aerolatus]GMA89091.1 hypothetical protein GCM10025868_43410 [Angustibacter aerolatus]
MPSPTSLPEPPRVVVVGEPAWRALLARADDVDPVEVDRRSAAVEVEDPAVILFTSGTSGRPKAVVLPARSLVTGAWTSPALLHCDERDRYCVSTGFGHVFMLAQCVLPAVCRGGAMVLSGPSFDAERVLETVERERCTVLHGAPTMFLSLLAVQQDHGFDLTSLRTGICGASAVSPSVMERVVRDLHLPDVLQAWGMTEVGGAPTTGRTWMPPERRVGTAGLAVPGVEVRVVDTTTGDVLGRGERGELQAARLPDDARLPGSARGDGRGAGRRRLAAHRRPRRAGPDGGRAHPRSAARRHRARRGEDRARRACGSSSSRCRTSSTPRSWGCRTTCSASR